MDVDVKFHPRCLGEIELYQKHASNKVRAVNYYSKIKKFENEAVYDKYLMDLKEVSIHMFDDKILYVFA